MKLCHLWRCGWAQRLSYRVKVRQKDKKNNRISLICGIQKNGTDDLICKAENRDTGVENKCMDTKRREGGGMN